MLKEDLERNPAALEHYRRTARMMYTVRRERREEQKKSGTPEPKTLEKLVEELRTDLRVSAITNSLEFQGRIDALCVSLDDDWRYLRTVSTRLGDVKLRAIPPLLRDLSQLALELKEFAKTLREVNSTVDVVCGKIREYVEDNQFADEPVAKLELEYSK